MRRRLLSLGLFGLLGVVGMLGFVSSSAAGSSTGWGTAVEVPGTAALNSGGSAVVNSVSCAAAGDCAAGGSYVDGSGNTQVFVVDETNGSWGNAVEVPGTAALNSGGSAVVNSVACAAAGDCAAGGSYVDGSGNTQVFVVNETNGSWGSAIQVPGTATLNSGGEAIVNSVSCATVGNCAAGGYYADGSGHKQAFVVDETNGSWGNAIEVPGTATLNSGGFAIVNSVSCTAAGDCTAGGDYIDSSGTQVFVVDETNGSWSNAIEVPGTAALNSGGAADEVSVSCATAGNCTAGGSYRDSSNHDQPFVVNETNGSWGTAIEVPGTATLNSHGYSEVHSVSCATAGNCTADGYYRDGSDNAQAFVVDETNGSWGTAIEVPGTAELNSGGSAIAQSVSCASAGNCAAGGTYRDSSGNIQVFVADETNGSWGTAIEVPGTASLNSGGYAILSSVSCATGSDCSAGGLYSDGNGSQAFVVSSTLKTDQTIQVSTHAPASAVYGTGFTVAATGGGSGNPVTYGSSGGCTHSGADFTMTSGTTACTVKYDQAGDANYNAAPEVTETVTAQKAGQTISVTTHSPSTAVYGTSFDVAANAPGGTVSFSASGACSHVGATFTMTSGTGTCSVHFDQAGDANYSAAPQVTESVTAQKAAQSISFSPLADHTYGDPDFDPGATASSGLTVSYGASGACSIVSWKVHLTGVGSCTVTASQAGSSDYNAASDVQQSFSIGTASLTITANDRSKAYGQTLNLGTSAFTPSGLVGSDSISSVTLTSSGAGAGAVAGSYAIVPSAAVAAGGTDLGNYSVSYVNGTLTVAKASQSISFSAIADRTWGDADFDPGATASSGLAVSYGASGACSIVSGMVHITGAGSCTVTASQAGNSDYAAAPDVQRTFSIGKATVTITASDRQKISHYPLTLGTAAFTTSGLIGSDSVSSVTLTSAGSGAGAAPGNYPIVPSAAVAGAGTALGNYTIQYVNGKLAVLNAGLVGLNGVSVSTAKGVVDSFNSSHGGYGGSNRGTAALVLSNGVVSLAGVALSGDVISTQSSVLLGKKANVSGNATAGSTVSISSSARVGGIVTQPAPSPPIAMPTVARCASFSKSTGIRGGKFVYSTKTGNLKVVSGTVTLAKGTYCFNNVTLASRSTLSVKGPVTIHLRGKLAAKGQFVNKTNSPKNLHIDTSFTGSNGMALAGGTRAYMTILAPGTTVTISGGSFFGTLLAGTVKLTGKTAFHADAH